MALRKIYGKNRRKVQVGIMVGKQVSREELYEQVWKTPVDKLAKEYLVSGRGLGKICGAELFLINDRIGGCYGMGQRKIV